ncbi:MAG: SurA N-terminal domain-containing protein, partial [Acidobacteriota bacterium]|nr:SurA N-terminal domain-containing protein [Acidobacteriota bacterium]
MRESARGNKASTRRMRAGTFARVLAAFSLLPFAFCLLPSRACGQEVVDRMVAVVNDTGLITYSDLLWQLALQPSVPLDRPRQDDLRGALDLLIGQRLILQEAEKLPAVAPTQKEIDDETTRLIGFFPSQAAFYERLARVGLGQDSA